MYYKRLKKARRIARKTFKRYNGKYPEEISPDEAKHYVGGVETHLGSYRKTKVPCSCPMCGNPRKYFGEKTVQEKKSDEDFKQQLNELEE
jgi:hypothetical protein